MATKSLKRKKLVEDVRSLINPGETVSGIVGERVRITTERFPEGVEYLRLMDLETPTETAACLWINGGLEGKLRMAKVQPGMAVEIVCKGKKPFTTMVNGKEADVEVNDYDIFELVAE